MCEELEGVKGGKTVARLYCMGEKNLFTIEKKKGKEDTLILKRPLKIKSEIISQVELKVIYVIYVNFYQLLLGSI